jgi:hypothetical protein
MAAPMSSAGVGIVRLHYHDGAGMGEAIHIAIAPLGVYGVEGFH